MEESRWKLTRLDQPARRAAAVRPVRVPHLTGYLDPLGVEPGARLRIHLSAPASHRISLLRLGRRALLSSRPDDGADREEAVELAHLELPQATPRNVEPGSFARAPSLPARPRTISVWVRLWRAPETVETFAWAALVSQFDFPDDCRWALAVDELGRPSCYLAAGGDHDRSFWTTAPVALSLGEWHHLACTAAGEVARLYVDGELAVEGRAAAEGSAGSSASGGDRDELSLRIAAAAESGVVDHLLDADLSDVSLFARPLDADEISRLAADRAAASVPVVAADALLAHWSLRESAGSELAEAVGGRDAELVNGATLGIPGPSASPEAGGEGYDPSLDPARGGAVRFAADDLLDCGWPATAELLVPPDAVSGTYCVRVTLAGATADPLELPFAVVRPRPRPRPARQAAVALLYATFTWTAYARRSSDGTYIPGLASSAYTRNRAGRLHFRLGTRMPLPRAQPFAHRTHLRDATLHQHLVWPERVAEAWLEREGVPFECITDADLDRDPALLEHFAVLMIVGHNEYWTSRMHDGVEAYLGGGGQVLCLSGNTAFWRCAFDRETAALEVRKVDLRDEGEGLPRSEWGERWLADGCRGGNWAELRGERGPLLGLETAGWIESGDLNSYAPYTVLEPAHFLFREPEPVPLRAGDLIGVGAGALPAASGYEFDVLPEALGRAWSPPGEMTCLAHARHDGDRFVVNWSGQPGYGADLIYWERPDGGRVFNAGATNYVGALVADPKLGALTRNVLSHFGVSTRA